MRERYIWLAVLVTTSLLLLIGVSFEAVAGVFTFVCFILFVAVEFWNLTRFFAKVAAFLSGEQVSPSVDNTMAMMDRSTGEYGATRNAAQDLRRRNG